MPQFICGMIDGGIVAPQQRVESRRTANFWHDRVDELRVLCDALGLRVLYEFSGSIMGNLDPEVNWAHGQNDTSKRYED